MTRRSAALSLAVLVLFAVPASAETADRVATPDRVGRQCCAGADFTWEVGDWMVCCYTTASDGRLFTETRAYQVDACRAPARPAERPPEARRIAAAE